MENFIGGNKELMEWFKRFVEYEGRDEIINNVPRNVNKVRLSVCRGLGPSYRLLPKLVGDISACCDQNVETDSFCRSQQSNAEGEMKCVGKY